MKICTIIGARPQFIKASVVSHEIKKMDCLTEIIIHTGQHYDANMSSLFFEELDIPREKYNLGVVATSHAEQTGKMLEGIEKILLLEKIDVVLVYGDTNSTLAGALAAAKLHIPVIHVEAGMRSFNKKMPEEINRILTDHIADYNLCSTSVAVDNLANEGLLKTAHLVGDVMYDSTIKFSCIKGVKIINLEVKINIEKGNYYLVTCHRAENTDDNLSLKEIVSALNYLSDSVNIIFPIHPRTKKMLLNKKLTLNSKIITIEPLGYLDMLLLEKHADMILTDSGGVQKEAFFMQVPCVTLRNETEWVETVELGWNKLAGANKNSIIECVNLFKKSKPVACSVFPYGDGKAAPKIAEFIKTLI